MMKRSIAAAAVVLGALLFVWMALLSQTAPCPGGRPDPEDLRIEALARLIEIGHPETMARLDRDAVRAHGISRDGLARYIREHPDCCIYGGRETGELTPVSAGGRLRGLGRHVVSIRLMPMPGKATYKHLRFNRCGDPFRGEH